MRHNKAVNHLGRKSGHRKALLSNMASSLILKKRIVTTVAKAKALKPYLEPLVTKSKEDTTHNRRVVFSYLKNKEAVTELIPADHVKAGDIFHLGGIDDLSPENISLYNENRLPVPQPVDSRGQASRSPAYHNDIMHVSYSPADELSSTRSRRWCPHSACRPDR